MTSTIFVATSPSDDEPGTVIVTVQAKSGDVTTIAYQGRHPTHKSVIGTATLPTSLENLALQLAQNDLAWRETLLKEVVASTRRAPEDLVMVVQHVHDEQRVWFEPHDTREHIADLEEQLRAVTAAAADWARRAGAAERRTADDNTRIEALIESRDYYAGALTALTKQLATPDFERLLSLRVSECTEAEQADALEGWLRQQVRWFDPLGMSHYEHTGDGPRNHIEFLLRRIDALRNPPKD